MLRRLVGVAVGLVVAALVHSALSGGSGVPAGTKDFVAGHGVAFTAPDGGFNATFPVTPKVDRQTETASGMTFEYITATAESDDYEMVAGEMVMPVAVPPGRLDDVLDQALNQGIGSVDGKDIAKHRTTHGVLPATEATFTAPDHYGVHALVMVSGQRVYVLLVHAKRGTEKLFDALNTSFVPLYV